MKGKKNEGFTGIDLSIAIVAILIFSGLIVSMMYHNFRENAKIKREAMAIIYLTETLENIGIEEYEQVVPSNINEFKPNNLEKDNYQLTLSITEEDNNITKKIKATISYNIEEKKYEHSMERIKIKE